MIIILLMSAKLATLGLLDITIFGSKDYNIIISVSGITKTVLSCDSNCNVYVSITLAFL